MQRDLAERDFTIMTDVLKVRKKLAHIMEQYLEGIIEKMPNM